MPSFVPECNNRCTDKGQLTQTKKKKKESGHAGCLLKVNIWSDLNCISRKYYWEYIYMCYPIQGNSTQSKKKRLKILISAQFKFVVKKMLQRF